MRSWGSNAVSGKERRQSTSDASLATKDWIPCGLSTSRAGVRSVMTDSSKTKPCKSHVTGPAAAGNSLKCLKGSKYRPFTCHYISLKGPQMPRKTLERRQSTSAASLATTDWIPRGLSTSRAGVRSVMTDSSETKPCMSQAPLPPGIASNALKAPHAARSHAITPASKAPKCLAKVGLALRAAPDAS